MSRKNTGINPQAARLISSHSRKLKTVDYYVDGIVKGDRVVLSQAITLIESETSAHRELAHQIVACCLPFSGNSIRIGITGAPGVGKSTFIESFGLFLIESGFHPGILAIDPSSQVSKGSILGDKTRMQYLSTNAAAFIRPSAAGSSLGGVARKTRETVLLCEAAGFDIILIETVGVGQSETTVHDMTDFFLLLLQPGGGDELQGIKRGIVEMADLLAVTKAEGEQETLAEKSKQAYQNALHLFPLKQNGWTPQVVTCSGITGKGVSVIWEMVETFVKQTKENGFFEENRLKQRLLWFQESINTGLKERFFNQPLIREQQQLLESQISSGNLSPFTAAEILLKLFFNHHNS